VRSKINSESSLPHSTVRSILASGCPFFSFLFSLFSAFYLLDLFRFFIVFIRPFSAARAVFAPLLVAFICRLYITIYVLKIDYNIIILIILIATVYTLRSKIFYTRILCQFSVKIYTVYFNKYISYKKIINA